MSDMNPFEPPKYEAPVDSDRGPAGIVLASLGARFGAAFIDSFIMIAIVTPLMWAFGEFDDLSRLEEREYLRSALWSVAGFFIWMGVNGYLLFKHGQSVGKRIVGIRIVNIDDNRRTPFSKLVLLRTLPVQLVAAIPLLGSLLTLVDVLFIFRQDRRCVHDLIAGTRVVAAERWLAQN
jgi:uncharacterized RDD family membrane protein YckC